MHCLRACLLVTALMVSTTAHAGIIVFDSDPFQGTTALTTPGRQIVGGGGGGTPITFDIASDVFVFHRFPFGVDDIQFVNDLAGNLPATGFNVAVVQDGNPPSGAAGAAANLIAAQLTTPGPGFFIYFNTGLNLPRLVYSTNLDDNTADLAILAQITNLTGQLGVLPTFTAANFAVPEPATWLLMATSAAAVGWRRRRRRASTT